MLEQLRRQSGSFIIWLIFGIIIAAFVLFFGPQASGDLGCGASDSYIIQVDDASMDISSWRFSMNSQRGGIPAEQRQTRALDALVGRALLANAARNSGLDVAEEQIVENLKRGVLFVLGMRMPKEAIFENGVFDFEKLDYQARQRGLPNVDALIAEQKEEVLANLMRGLLLQTQVSPEEAEQRYIQQNSTVTAKYVKFDVGAYQNAMTLGDDDIERYLAGHEDEVKKLYEARKSLYQDIRPQVRVRHIMVKKDAAAPEGARTKIDAIHKELAGGADFGKLARERSDDDRSKMRGGDLGWRPKDSIGFGKELSDAAAFLTDNQSSDVIETESAFHILRIEGRREGTLGYDDVKIELADNNARMFFAKAAAKRDADAALAKLKGGMTLEELFPAKSDGEGKTGAVTRIERTIPASWGPVAQAGAAEAAADTAAADSAAADSAPVDSAPVDERALAPEIAIPAVTVPGPEVQTLGPTPRRGDILPGLGQAPELADALFGELEVGKLADEAFELPTGYVLVRVEDRQAADLDKWDGKQVSVGEGFDKCSFPLQMVAVTRSTDSLPAECMAIKKGIDNLQAFLFEECSKAAQEGRIRVNSAFLSQESSQFKYSPCGTLDFESALIQVMSMSGSL